MVKLSARVLLIVAALAWCDPRVGASTGDTPKTVTATRLYVRNNCVLGFKPPPAGQESVLGAFIPILLDKAFSGIVAAFKKAGEDQVVQKSAARPIYLYRQTDGTLSLNPTFGCLILVHGDFPVDGADDAPGAEPTVTKPSESPKPENAVKLLQAAKIPVTAVHMLYEARVEQSRDQTAVLYQSRFLIVNRFIGDSGDKARGLVVNLNLVGAGAKPDAPVLSSALINLGEIAPGTFLGPEVLAANGSQWAGGLAISDTSQEAFKQFGRKVALYMPVNVDGVFAETKKGNAVAKFIGDVLDGAKKDVVDLANKAINPDEREKAAKTANDDREKSRAAEEAAYETYLKALADGNDTDLKKFTVERTQRLWCLANAAAKQLGPVTGDRHLGSCTGQ